MFRRCFTGKDRWNRTAGITELHKNLPSVRKQIYHELVIVDDLPA